MMDGGDGGEPVICFGQQPCGFFPKRFLVAKILSARQLQKEIGGRIVFFYHDSDHDSRETLTVLRERLNGREARLNFAFLNGIQKRFSPLYAKVVPPGWKEGMLRQLPKYTEPGVVAAFASAEGNTVAGFCLSIYRAMGLLDGIEVVRSGDPRVREAAGQVEDFYVDVPLQGELVRARRCGDGRLRLHHGGSKWEDLPECSYGASAISPTRDSRLRWMQSVVRCTHYIAGAGELGYLDQGETPEISFVRRQEIQDASHAYAAIIE